jgi:hypothetical protein
MGKGSLGEVLPAAVRARFAGAAAERALAPPPAPARRPAAPSPTLADDFGWLS